MMLNRLEDAVANRERYGEDFYVPEPERLDQLQPGDCIKVVRNNIWPISGCVAERFWILVTGITGEFIHGTVDNKLLQHPDLPLDTRVTVERRHVYDCILIHAGERQGMTR
jgi:hypothetical protein